MIGFCENKNSLAVNWFYFKGCGRSLTDFKWFSSDEAIISISSSGVAYARGPGETTVKAVSTYDSLNYDEVSYLLDCLFCNYDCFLICH